MANKRFTGTTDGDLDKAANYAPAGVPVTADNIWYENCTVTTTAGFDQSGVVPAHLYIDQSMEGLMGDADEYVQYGGCDADIGYHFGHGAPSGSKRIKLHMTGGSAAGIVTVHNSADDAEEADLPPIRLKMDSASMEVHVRKGKVGIACEAGETATLKKLVQTFVDSQDSDADVVLGAGVTISEIEKTGGKLVLQGTCPTVANDGGTLQTEGSGTITTLTVTDGEAILNSTGTIATLEAKAGEIDFTQSKEARTVTNLKIWAGATVKYDPDVLTITNWLPQEAMSISAAAPE